MSPEESVRKSSQLLRMRKMNFLGRRVSLFNGTGHELDKKQEGLKVIFCCTILKSSSEELACNKVNYNMVKHG